MYLLIYVIPLINILTLNRTVGKKGIILSIINSLILLIITIMILIEQSELIINLGNWINIYNIHINWIFRFDSLNKSMLLIILLISLLVQYFSYEYMIEDPHIIRFFLYLNLFTYQMLLLVTGDNFLTLFLGWEGVGLVSYLLVNFWYTRIEANHASLKAFILNRIGDLGLTIGIILWFIILGDVSIYLLLNNINTSLIYILGLFLFIGAIAKSAQIGLHSWLTSAMEGPTPVSALLHAATMVTAGIYLLMRLSIFIEWSDDLLLLISWFGGLSALTGAIGGLYEYDIKKIIAYSTISQLGYMVITSAFSLYNITLWHLINHALFKALLFLSAGAIIHSIYDLQDIRKFGSFKLYLPHLYNFIFIGNLSLMAFPFFTGFYSKDLILDLIFSSNSNFLFFLIYITALLTASYSIKLLIMTFLSLPNFSYHNSPLLHNLPLSFGIPLTLLSFGAILFGDISSNILGITSTLSIFIHPSHFLLLDNLILNLATNLTLIPLFFFILLIFTPKIYLNITNILPNFNLFNSIIIFKCLGYSNIFLRYIDRGLLEILTPYGFTLLFHYLSFRLEYLSTGYIYHLLLPLISFLFFILFF